MRGLNHAKQNILSIGEDIQIWNPSSDGQYNLHFYYPNAVGDGRLRFSAVSSNKYNNVNRRTMGVIDSDVFLFDEDTSPIVVIKFDRNGFYVNGVLIDRSNFSTLNEPSKTPEVPNNPTPPEVWTYPDYFMRHFTSTLNLQFGSEEGTMRTWAYYEYIKYRKKL